MGLHLKAIKMNTIGYFEIQSSNPSREIDFYKNVFGWKFTRDELIPIPYYRIELTVSMAGSWKDLPKFLAPKVVLMHLSALFRLRILIVPMTW